MASVVDQTPNTATTASSLFSTADDISSNTALDYSSVRGKVSFKCSFVNCLFYL